MVSEAQHCTRAEIPTVFLCQDHGTMFGCAHRVREAELVSTEGSMYMYIYMYMHHEVNRG